MKRRRFLASSPLDYRRSRRILAVLLLVSTVVVHPIDSFGRLGHLSGAAGGGPRAATGAWDRGVGPFVSIERRPSATKSSRWATIPNSSATVAAEGRPPATGASDGSKAKGRAEEKSGSKATTKQGGRGGRGGRGGGGRGRKGQGGWRKKGDYAKKEGLLHQMKWPKTRRKALITMWESDLVLKRDEYSALLTAACQLGWTAMASTIMEEMAANDVPLTTATYDAAIKAACKANKDRLALLLIVDQYARWQADKLEDKAALRIEGIGEGGKAAKAVGKGGGGSGSGGGSTGKGLSKSHFRTNLAKVLQVTSRTGDLEGSLEVLKYMSAMGISANPAVCQHLLATACKAGRGHAARVPAILRAMGECGLRPDMSLLDALEMLFDVDSPEVALDLVLEVAKIGREKRGIGKIWRFDTNASAAEAFSFVLKRAEKTGRSDVVGMTIHAVLSDFPQSLYFGRARLGDTGAGAGAGAGTDVRAAETTGDGDFSGVSQEGRGRSTRDDSDSTVTTHDNDNDEEDEEEEEEDEEDFEEDYDDVTANNDVDFGASAGTGAGGSSTAGGVSASKLSSAVSGALTGLRAGKGKEEGDSVGSGAGGAQQQPHQKGKKWSRLGQKELNRQRRTEAIHRQKQSVSVLNHILADLVNSPRSGHTAAGVLDRWRSITLGGGWPGGESAGRDEGGSAPEMVRYSRPTAASYMLTMSALVQSGQWGRARSLLEVMEVDGVPPNVDCYSHLLTLLHTRLSASSRLTPDPSSPQESEAEEPLLSPPVMGDVVGDVGGDVVSPVFLWSEPTYEWDEVVSLIADARSTERGKYGLTEEMYLTALDVLQIVSQRPEHVSLGVVGPAAPLPPPPAKVFLDRAECLLEWALDAGMEMTAELLFPVLTLSHTARDSKKVFQFFEAMLDTDTQRQGGAASTATFAEAYNMALQACEFGGEPERALAYLRTMGSATGLKPQANQYEAAINAMVAAGRYRDAYQLLAEAVENDVERVGVYDAALKACALEGNPVQAETLIRVMLETGCTPGSTAMSQLLLAYGNSGDVEGIQSVMARAANEVFSGGVMNALVYESVLGVLAPLEAWQDAETLVKEGETVLPGSLTYRTYGYLMVAYAAEKQWGAAIELALGTGRWPEKTSDGPEGRFHPPELRETTCAVALKWLLTQGVDGIDSVAFGGGGGRGVGHGDGGEQQAEAMERALEYRRCGRELFTRLLASGAPLRSVRVIKGALGGIGAEPVPTSSSASSDPAEGSEDAPIYWKQTMPFWGDPEKPPSPTPASAAAAAKGWKPLAAENDWLLSVLPEEDAEREVEAQALHVGTVVEVFLRLYSTCEQPGANGLHSPTAVGLLQQAVSAACLADDPDLADRLLTAWLDRACLTQLSQARLRSALRISLSEVLAAFFAEGQGEEGVYRGLSLIGRCRDAGLPPYPFDFLGAMRACNTAGLYSTALRLFDQLTAASEYPEQYPEPDFPNYDDDNNNSEEQSSSDDPGSFDSDGSGDGSGVGVSGSPTPESQERSQQQQYQNLIDEGGQEEEETGVPGGERGPTATTPVAAARDKSSAVGIAATARDAEGGRESRSKSSSNNRGRSNGDGQDDGSNGSRERSSEGGAGMRFENLNDIPDGELIPAAAAGIALESCFLGGRRDQAMEIVWRLIRRRHPLTEACRNRAIVALTSGGHPDMALDMARGMEKDQHYADRATVEFVERFQKRAFDAAAAADLAQQQQRSEEAEEQESLDEEDGQHEDEDDADWEPDIDEEQEGEEDDVREFEGDDGGGGGGEFDVDELVSSSRLSSSPRAQANSDASGNDQPSELVLRFLPLLSEALRSKLRPGEEDSAPPINGAAGGGEEEDRVAMDAESDQPFV